MYFVGHVDQRKIDAVRCERLQPIWFIHRDQHVAEFTGGFIIDANARTTATCARRHTADLRRS
ncbi:MAG: hypothetical protein ABI137_09690 [Antricoccus sp.]